MANAMKVQKINGFQGFDGNLKKSTLQLENITVIISPNNYGKSNLLEAIDFGVDFLTSNSKDRKVMMRWVRGIPINKSLENEEFFFELELEDETLGDYRYGTRPVLHPIWNQSCEDNPHPKVFLLRRFFQMPR